MKRIPLTLTLIVMFTFRPALANEPASDDALARDFLNHLEAHRDSWRTSYADFDFEFRREKQCLSDGRMRSRIWGIFTAANISRVAGFDTERAQQTHLRHLS